MSVHRLLENYANLGFIFREKKVKVKKAAVNVNSIKKGAFQSATADLAHFWPGLPNIY